METHNRRTSLKCARATAVGVGLPGCTTIIRHDMSNTHEITVRVEAPAGPLVSRTFVILKDRIQQRCLARVVEADAGAQSG